MKEIKCFMTNSDFITPDNRTVAEVYELSDEGYTFSKRKQHVWLASAKHKGIVNFHYTEENELTQEEAEFIFKVIEDFSTHITTKIIENKDEITTTFLQEFNASSKTKLLNIDYNTTTKVGDEKYPDYVLFKTKGLSCSCWLSDFSFKQFYPLYDIDIIPPFQRFEQIVRNDAEMIYELDNFNLAIFAESLDIRKEGHPSTFTKVINVPYYPDKGDKGIPCNFGFNIYGKQGEFDHLLRETLYQYLNKKLGLEEAWIEKHFPDIFKVNEFFIIPEWTSYAIPFATGQGSINSQILPTYPKVSGLEHFIPSYADDIEDLKKSAYDVPFAYNNITTRIVNGRRTVDQIKDFRKYYHDLITYSSKHPDFDRMSSETMRFLIMMESMFYIADSNAQTEIFSKMMVPSEFKFSLSERTEVEYLSILFRDHRYYMLPRYEYERIEKLHGLGDK